MLIINKKEIKMNNQKLKEYSLERITIDDLKEFASCSLCFTKQKFKNEMPTIIIFSQGGALHYAYCNELIKEPYKGLKDIDIWVFYDEKLYPKIKKYNRQTYHVDYTGSNLKFGKTPKEPKHKGREYKGRKMDILVRAIPFTNPNDFNSVKEDIKKYFCKDIKRRSQLEKAGFAIYPDDFCGKELWLQENIKLKNGKKI